LKLSSGNLSSGNIFNCFDVDMLTHNMQIEAIIFSGLIEIKRKYTNIDFYDSGVSFLIILPQICVLLCELDKAYL
jgi:hypothetical protein